MAEDYPDEECSNCGGEGIVYRCFEEFACLDPEGGCDDCARVCDWCQRKALTRPAAAGEGT